MDRRKELLVKYQQKTISRDELEELFADLQTSSLRQYEPWMDEVWQNLPDGEETYPEAAHRVYASLQKELSSVPPPPLAGARLFRWAGVAALLLLSLGTVFYFFLSREPAQHFLTGTDETRTLVLPDASVVTLNERSELYYEPHWDPLSPREVWLTGEAYFAVRHTASDQKFIVHSGLVAIEVLGTEFNVHNRDLQPEITLATGSVQLTTQQKDNRQRIMMKPGEQVILTEAQTFRRNTVNPAVYTAWKQQELVLDNTPLPEVVRLLERQHAVRVIIQDSTLQTITLSGTYPNQELDVVLDMLSDLLIADARVERIGEQVTIQRKATK